MNKRIPLSLVFLALFVLIIPQVNINLYADDDYQSYSDEKSKRGEYYENEENEDLSEFLGYLALITLLAFNVLYYYSMFFKSLPVEIKKQAPYALKFPIRLKNQLRNFHYIGNPIAIGIAWLHGIYAEDSNALVWLGWGLMLLLSLTGLIMKLQRADEPGAKLNRLIHTQHLLSIFMILLLLLGHAFLD